MAGITYEEMRVLLTEYGGGGGSGGTVSDTAVAALLTDIKALLSTEVVTGPRAPLLAPGDLISCPFDFTATTDQSIVPLVALMKQRIHRLELTTDAEVTIELWDGPSAGGGASTGGKRMTWLKVREVVRDFDSRAWYGSSTGNAIILKASAATRVTGTAWVGPASLL